MFCSDYRFSSQVLPDKSLEALPSIDNGARRSVVLVIAAFEALMAG
jgi:hypothetical protein